MITGGSRAEEKEQQKAVAGRQRPRRGREGQFGYKYTSIIIWPAAETDYEHCKT